jgi:hypothetical protein
LDEGILGINERFPNKAGKLSLVTKVRWEIDVGRFTKSPFHLKIRPFVCDYASSEEFGDSGSVRSMIALGLPASPALKLYRA